MGNSRQYLEHLNRAGETVAIPATVIPEFLAHFDTTSARDANLAILTRRFQILPFDLPAAARAASILAEKARLQEIRLRHPVSRQAFRLDVAHLACAVAQGATAFITEDQQIQDLAEALAPGFRVMGVPVVTQQATLPFSEEE